MGSQLLVIAVHHEEEKIAAWKRWEQVSRAAEKVIPAPEGYGTTEGEY